ncbi:uncharacterized protein VTP21DRAFT_4524 [Calcarisporiella thermophila]|uniref:uncharacterized protein n=1 Tax=Calcarisporiella thermophila TaxID=911321 RepID=UPI003743BB4C
MSSDPTSQPLTVRQPRVEIEYCTQCRWMLRAGWAAQELLTTFSNQLGEVALIPGKQQSGIFCVRVDGEVIFDRKKEGRFPEMKELKQLVRNRIAPEMALGHSDSPVKSREAAAASREKKGEEEAQGGAAEAPACPL